MRVPLDPQAQIIIDQIEALGFGDLTEDTDPAQMRAMMDAAAPPSAITMHEVWDREIPGPSGPIPIRIYRPTGNAPQPVIVYAHDGGWVLGSLETHDDVCRGLAAGVDAIVVAVDYRLAPEHRFPAAIDDYLAALAWTYAHAPSFGGDPNRLALAGDRAGANLAAIGAQHARALGVAVVDASEGADVRVSPLRAADLTGLAPAFVITAQYDPLRDQGRAYAAALQAAGNPVTSTTYEGIFHGFSTMSALLDAAKVAFVDAIDALRIGLAVG